MRKYHLTIILFLVAGLLFAQEQEQIIHNYDVASPDTNFWDYRAEHGGQHYETSTSADSALGWIQVSHPTDNKAEGAGSMQLEYSAHNIEGWGGYTKLEHWNPDSNGVYDWSKYDTISFWYNNTVPASQASRVHLRLNLHDVNEAPNGNKTYTIGDTEYYYSFIYVLDDEPGWNQVKIPLVNNYDWDGNGFNLTGWSGQQGDAVLDKDKIKGYSLEFSINGGGDGDFVTGTVLLDKLHLRGLSPKPWLIFNGKTVNNDFTMFAWGQSSLEVIEAGGEDPATNALLWTQGNEWGNGWSGAGWNVDPAMDLETRWALDSLRFKAKADAGTGEIRLQFESGAAEGIRGYNLTLNDDGNWHEYAIALSDFVTFDDKPNFDSTNITVFQFMGEGSAVAGQKVYFDFMWTGEPEIDVIAPEAPTLVVAGAGVYVNVVSWQDVPGEDGEVYNIYFAESPITDVKAEGVDIVKLGVGENNLQVEHVLKAPATDQEVTYYYAVVCVDAAGNESPVVGTGPTTNTARGVTTIHPEAPANFVADADLSEWAAITPFRMFPEDGTGTVVTNQVIDGNADLSVNAWVAMDAEYLYFAFDVEDDIVDNTHPTSYLRDGCELFIGLYDWRGPSHTTYKLGDEPDYNFRFISDSAMINNIDGGVGIAYTTEENYAYKEIFPSGYIIEGRISFADIAAISDPDAAVFEPVVGKRIKIDYSINDADATGAREAIMTYSPDNQDQSWADVSRWTYTWIGDQFVDVEEISNIPTKYELSQNYPNPFNPSTIINYSIMEKGNVALRIYNILGQEVATLVNEVQRPGVYQVNFDASELASGLYIYQISTGSFVTSKKMLLLK